MEFIVETSTSKFKTTANDRFEVIARVEAQLSLQNYMFKTKETLKNVSEAVKAQAQVSTTKYAESWS